MRRLLHNASNGGPLAAVAVFAVIAVVAWFFLGVISGADNAPEAENESTYTLKFGADFKPALAARDDLGISVVIAMDVSGSMSSAPASGGAPKFVQASAALGRVVDVLERLVRDAPRGQVLNVGVLRFNEGVGEVLPLTAMDKAGIVRLRELSQNPAYFTPSGSTAIGAAIERGVEWLSQSGTVLRSLIVVTDGENKTGVLPAWALSAVYGNRNTATTAEFPVFTSSVLVSFIGFDIQTGVFEPLTAYGARVMSATNQAQLADALSGILEADITKLEAPSMGAEK